MPRGLPTCGPSPSSTRQPCHVSSHSARVGICASAQPSATRAPHGRTHLFVVQLVPRSSIYQQHARVERLGHAVHTSQLAARRWRGARDRSCTAARVVRRGTSSTAAGAMGPSTRSVVQVRGCDLTRPVLRVGGTPVVGTGRCRDDGRTGQDSVRGTVTRQRGHGHRRCQRLDPA